MKAYFCTWRCNCTNLQTTEGSISLRCPVHDKERLDKPSLEEVFDDIELGLIEELQA